MSESTFVTVDEIARELRVSKMTVYRLIERGDLPATRVGRSIRIKVADYHAYMKREATV